MNKRLLAFDLDKTLTRSKTPVEDPMAALLCKAMEKFQVCVISGCSFKQFRKQLLSNLKATPQQLSALHIMPTCGTQYYVFDLKSNDWQKVYGEDLPQKAKDKITQALEQSLRQSGYMPSKIWGPLVEDRETQMTLSTLGQDAPVEIKEAWDPANHKKQKISNIAAKLLPEFEVRVGGLTSIDVTRPGVDKAYGMKKLMKALQISKPEILFMGDRMEKGGNDYPVKAMGIESIEVTGWHDTASILEEILRDTD